MDRLTIAVQKSGRLSSRTSDLLSEAGIAFQNGSTAKLRSPATNFPLDILYLRDDDIPQCVADGVADVGVVGENVLRETGAAAEIVERLGFGRCRLSIAAPRDSPIESASDLEGHTIATSYPNVLEAFLRQRQVSASIRYVNGSTEIAPSVGIAEAVCDLVSTGSTLVSNGLRELETVMRCEAVLIRGFDLADATQRIFDDLCFRFRAVIRARDYRYVLLNCPSDQVARIAEILPGIKSPTVMPLELEGWSSVHTVIREDDFWSRIERLREAGAEGVLVLPVEKMVV